MADVARLKTLKANRTSIKASCTRVQTYLNGVNEDDVNIVELRQRLQRALTLLHNFNDIQTQIEELEDDPMVEASHQDERDCFETRYFAATSALETLINKKEVEVRRIQASANPLNTRELREETPTSQATNDHLKLPRVTMPIFSGKYEEWVAFKNIFVSMIHQNATLPNTQKMQYLLSVLKGEAHDVVSSLETSDENYSEAWEMLKDRYDNNNLIVQRHIRALFDLPIMNKENHMALRRMLDTVLKHLRALKALKRPTDQWSDLMIHLIASRLDQTTSKEWEISIKKGEMPTFDQLMDFLAQRCRAMEAAARNQRTSSATTHQGKSEHNKNTLAHISTTSVMCGFCGTNDHPIYKCSDFLQLGVEQRIKEAQARKLCLNCLRVASHRTKQCTSGSCRKCAKRHNTLLHLEQPSKNRHESVPVSAPESKNDDGVPSSVNLASVRHEKQVLLSTAVIVAIGSRGTPVSCRALLDCGSQSCFVTTNFVDRLGLQQIATNIPISGLAGLSTQSHKLAKITIKSRINGYQTSIECLVIENITQSIPTNSLNLGELIIPDGVTLANPQFNQTSGVDLLIGAEIFFDLLCIGKIKLGEDQPTWQKTVFGWIASGKFMTRNQPSRDTLCHLATNDDLNANISRFWQIESSTRQETRTPEERLCEGQFAQSYKRTMEGRFIVTLPTKDEILQQLGESRETALQRFKALERKLDRKPRLKSKYSDFIHEYADLQHMRELDANSPEFEVRPHFYLPHHCVIKEASVTTKLRVVFDASCKTTSCISLNDALMVGRVIQQDLFSILLRFRSFKYALTADIAKMYRQVLINESQVPLQRILWRDSSSESVKTFELLTLTYGTGPASFLATKVIHQLSELENSNFPVGAAIARRDFYVDDLITGANTKEDVRTIRDETAALLKRGGFVLRQWASNDAELLDSTNESSTANAVLALDKDGTSKTLGVR